MGFDETVTSAVEKVIPGVVNISEVKLIKDAHLQVHPVPGVGSGFIIDSEGYVLTNAHVVLGSSDIKVTLEDGRTFPAKIRGMDTMMDLAVIKIAAVDLPVPEMAKNNNLKIGQMAIAIGSPLGLVGGAYRYRRSGKRYQPVHPDRDDIHGGADTDRCGHQPR